MAISRLGPQFSILRPLLYFAVFITADVISLILQAVGGGQASASAASGTPTTTATNIMVAGIIFQVISMGIFILCGADFLIRFRYNRPYAFQTARMSRKGVVGEKGLHHVSSDQARVATPGNLESQNGLVRGEENMTRWWIMMFGVMVSSMMIIIRGKFTDFRETEFSF